MNVHDPKFETPKVTTGPLPSSKKIYARPETAPDLKVPVREIMLSEGAGEPNVPVYDTTGPYTDPNVEISVEKGLARDRTAWVKERGGVEEYEGRTIKPEDNGNVERQACGARLSRRQPPAARPARPARHTA